MITDIRVQKADFSVAEEYRNLCREGSGAVVFFVGRVRAEEEANPVTAMQLEHYPGMTENALQEIAAQAHSRWPLEGLSIVHRVGHLAVDEQIVFVGVSAQHRQGAFSASEFVMDYLKHYAPFWKKEIRGVQAHWVEAKHSDTRAAQRWQKT